MNDWDKALFMLNEGFTLTQLENLRPSDADAWVRLKTMVVENGIRLNKRYSYVKDKLTTKVELMREAINHCEVVHISDGQEWYYTADVESRHDKSKGTFYLHLNHLKEKKKVSTKHVGKRAVMCFSENSEENDSRRFLPNGTHFGCSGVNNQGNPCKVRHSTLRTHPDTCKREDKHFCWMHCDCATCSQKMKGSVKTRGIYYLNQTKEEKK
jgi:hypothetical protein